MNREELEAKIMWNGGGTGFGLCSVASMMCHAMDAPTKDKPDYISIVAVGLPKEKYTTEELEKIVTFSDMATAKYDKICCYRRGCNLIFLDKQGEDGTHSAWLRKRLSWEFGPFFSDTLDEAIEIMTR